MSLVKHIERREAIMVMLASVVSGPLRAQDATARAAALSIAIPGFFGITPDELEKGRGIALLIGSDLRDSGKFALLNPAKYSGMVTNTDPVPEFDRWRALKAEGLVTGRLSLQPDGRFKVEFRLWDVQTGQQLSGAQYFVAPNDLNRLAHLIADSIYERLIGPTVRFEDKN